MSIAATAGHRSTTRGADGDVYDFGGLALLSFADVAGYLTTRDEEELPVAVRRLHPVDALVHGVLSAREARRGAGGGEGKDKDKDKDKDKGAGLQGAFDAAAAAAVSDPEKDKGGKDGPVLSAVDKDVPALEAVATGVHLKGTLSLLDESGFRRAAATAATGVDPLDDVAKEEKRRARQAQRAQRRSRDKDVPDAHTPPRRDLTT